MKYLAGLVAWLALHAAIVWCYAPRESKILDPVRISRTPSLPNQATILFAGDTAEIDRALPTILEKGWQYPFSLTVDLIRDADLAIANLEAPISDRDTPIGVYTRYVYRGNPESAAAMAWAGFDLMTLANNHMVDQGRSGIADTVRFLGKSGIEAIGASPVSESEARRGAIVTLGDLRVGVLAYCEDQFFFRVWMDLFARRGRGGVAALSEANLADDIARLRPQVDVLVVALHAGDNYKPPRASTLRIAERAIDLGADLVVGHHPHVGHPVALHNGKPILLSLGNYVFGTLGKRWLDYGWLALVHATGKKLDRIELIPIAVQNDRIRYRPFLIDGDERDRAIADLAARSTEYGAKLRSERGRAILDL
jgi:poly-gamma-glutamate synthesis protein (capsule biosynthesis protein)